MTELLITKRSVGDTFKRRGVTYKIKSVRWEPVYTIDQGLFADIEVSGDEDFWWKDAEFVKPWFEVGASYKYPQHNGIARYMVRDVWEDGGKRHVTGIFVTGSGDFVAWARTEGNGNDTFDEMVKVDE